MTEQKTAILSFNELLIGYSSGEDKKILLSPLSGFASPGELIAVIGENGIGKSTLLRTITGLQEPIEGEVLIRQKPLRDYKNRSLALKIGYISTEQVKVPNMSVHDLVSLGRYPHTDWTGRLQEEDHRAVEDAIEKTGLSGLRNRNINEISDGERQRAMIARVLAQDSDILVMDEPTAFLDIRSRYEIVHLLHDLSRNRKKTIIFSTHDLPVAAGECDKIWLILKNEFIEGAPEDLIIEGRIGDLFGDSVVKFNSGDGSFSFCRETRGRVTLESDSEADSMEKYWTIKALARAGYGLTTDHSGIMVRLSGKKTDRRWILEDNEETAEFNSIYSLVNWLNNRIKTSDF